MDQYIDMRCIFGDDSIDELIHEIREILEKALEEDDA